MSSATHSQTQAALNELATSIGTYCGWFLALGVLQILAGIVAISFSFAATLASIAFLGCILLVASGSQVFAATMARSWRGFFPFLLVGILYGVTGSLTLAHPIAAAEGLTLMLAAAFIAGGVFRISVSVVERFPSWGWVLVNGITSILLGVLIAAQWPVSGLWVIGTFVGVDLLMNGASWIAMSLEGRAMSAPIEE
ncbi:MAG: HdeD family acid-resistance protein [Pirellulaceae bacterium]